MLFKIRPGTDNVIVAPLIFSELISGSIVSTKPAAPTFCIVSATVAMLAASDSKSNVYVHITIFPCTNVRMNGSVSWQLSTVNRAEEVFPLQTSDAAASGKCTSESVGAAK